jgi:hypothetical protein
MERPTVVLLDAESTGFQWIPNDNKKSPPARMEHGEDM